MPWPLYQGKDPQNPLGRKLSGPQILSGHNGEEKENLSCPSQEVNSGHTACSLVTIVTELKVQRTDDVTQPGSHIDLHVLMLFGDRQ